MCLLSELEVNSCLLLKEAFFLKKLLYSMKSVNNNYKLWPVLEDADILSLYTVLVFNLSTVQNTANK